MLHIHLNFRVSEQQPLGDLRKRLPIRWPNDFIRRASRKYYMLIVNLRALHCTIDYGVGIGDDILSIEGRAIRPEYQNQGLGSLALKDILQKIPNITAAASVTRNPAVLKLMGKNFRTVSPDLGAVDPLHFVKENDRVQKVSTIYAEHIGADSAQIPFVFDRYAGGLYGDNDLGKAMPISEIAQNPQHGIIMVAIDRRGI